MDWAEARMDASLRQRKEKGTLRRLPAQGRAKIGVAAREIIDFSSNDYLGLGQSAAQAERVEELFAAEQQSVGTAATTTTTALLGATGSRLLSGDSPAFHALEAQLATIHEQPAALLCNSGYDANLAVVSSLPCDVIVYDEFAHNSLHMAMRLWQTRDNVKQKRLLLPFSHNSISDLERQLKKACLHSRNNEGNDKAVATTAGVVVIVESVYSMDGDCAPLSDILEQSSAFGARVVVDEAHGLGACGPTGLLASLGLHQHPALLSVVYTFGKAAGCHGAVVTGSQTLKDYLVNFGYPFIYSTALPLHSLCTIRASYETMTCARGDALRERLRHLIQVFQTLVLSQVLTPSRNVDLIPSETAIQALVVPGNQRCTMFCEKLWQRSSEQVRLFPIKSPTVPAGMERVRIVLHSHNTEDQVAYLVRLIRSCLEDEDDSQQHYLQSKL